MKSVEKNRARIKRFSFPGSKMVRHFILLLLAGVALFPLYLMVVMSFRTNVDIIGRAKFLLPPLHPHFNNFKVVFEAAPFGVYFLNTVFVVAVTVLLQLLLIIPAAYVFARVRFSFSGVLFVLYVIQIMLPVDILIVPLYRIMRSLNLLNTRIAMALPFIGSGYACFLLRQAFKQIPQSLEDAAVIDGCGPLRFIWHVLIPLARPAIMVFTLISIATHWNDYLWPLVVTDSPRVRTLTIGLAMFVKQESGADWGVLAAGALFITLPIVILILITGARS